MLTSAPSVTLTTACLLYTSFRERIIGRYAVGDVLDPVTGKVIVPEGKMIDLYDANDIEAAGITLSLIHISVSLWEPYLPIFIYLL